MQRSGGGCKLSCHLRNADAYDVAFWVRLGLREVTGSLADGAPVEHANAASRCASFLGLFSSRTLACKVRK